MFCSFIFQAWKHLSPTYRFWCCHCSLYSTDSVVFVTGLGGRLLVMMLFYITVPKYTHSLWVFTQIIISIIHYTEFDLFFTFLFSLALFLVLLSFIFCNHSHICLLNTNVPFPVILFYFYQKLPHSTHLWGSS